MRPRPDSNTTSPTHPPALTEPAAPGDNPTAGLSDALTARQRRLNRALDDLGLPAGWATIIATGAIEFATLDEHTGDLLVGTFADLADRGGHPAQRSTHPIPGQLCFDFATPASPIAHLAVA